MLKFVSENLFSLHPGYYLKRADRKRLVETFTYLASLEGFDKEEFSKYE